MLFNFFGISFLDLKKTVHVTKMRGIVTEFLSMKCRDMLKASVDETVMF